MTTYSSKNIFTALNSNEEFPPMGDAPIKNGKRTYRDVTSIVFQPAPYRPNCSQSGPQQSHKGKKGGKRQQSHEQVARSKVFERLADKNAHAKSLARTRPCFHVVPKVKNGKLSGYGTCYREVCTFAHSLDEFNIARCAFGEQCTKFDCRFLHPGETVREYYGRTGLDAPDLPKVTGKHHQPTKKALGSAVNTRPAPLAPKLAIDLAPAKAIAEVSDELPPSQPEPAAQTQAVRVIVPSGSIAAAATIAARLGLSGVEITESETGDEVDGATVMRVPTDAIKTAIEIGFKSDLGFFQIIEA